MPACDRGRRWREVRTWGACEDLCHVEGLAQEALHLASARHRHLVLLGKLVHTQDGNDILQILVILQRKATIPRLHVKKLGHQAAPLVPTGANWV